MKYIIMCGGDYQNWNTPRHLLSVGNEKIVERTIRLLRENGITDVYISTNNEAFRGIVPILSHHNDYDTSGYNKCKGSWCSAFYPTNDCACYIFGDVVFSEDAIRTIVTTDTDDIEFFASAPPFAKNYIKPHAEPFALKVVNQNHLRSAIEKVKKLDADGKFARKPIMWELWQVIKDTPLNKIDYTNYTIINDYTCDIDDPNEINKFNVLIKEAQNG